MSRHRFDLRWVLFGAALLLPRIYPEAAQAASSPSTPVIQACRIQLTELAKRATFRATLRYSLTTDTAGRVVGVTDQESNDRAAAFVVPESVATCLRSWTLRSSEKYEVTIVVASIEDTVIDIALHGEPWLRLIVPWK